MKSLLTTTALVALLGMAPAFAAETPAATDQPTANDVLPDPNATAPAAQPDATTAPAAQPDAATNPDAAATPDTMKKDDSAAAPADQSKDQAATAPAAGDKFLTEQASGEWLASSLIGASVYNSADESLGDINDVVFSEDGSIKAVVIGVGGFLGIGEKSVAVDFKSLSKSTDASGNDKFVINATKEELDAAPAFVTLVEKKRMEAAPPAADTTAPAADAPAPAPAPEPAPAQ